MTVMYVDSHGVYRERLAHPSLEAERDAALRAVAAEPQVFTQQDHAVATLMQIQIDQKRAWEREEAQMAAQQQAGQQAVYNELRALLPAKLEEDARTTQATLQAAQRDVEQARAAVQQHGVMRPKAGASPKDIEAWAREKGMLAGMVEAHEAIVAEAAAAYQGATQRLQAGMRQVFDRRRAELEQSIQVEWRNDMQKVDQLRAEVDRLVAAAQVAHQARQQQLNTLMRYFPGA